MKTTKTFLKNNLYTPEDLIDITRECNKYFTQDGMEEWKHPDYEYGTLKCIKSFKITTTITELTK